VTEENTSASEAGSRGRVIPIRTYVLKDQTPGTIQFSRHMLRFVGLKPFEAGIDLLWGVQGTASLNKADGFASRDAAHLQRRVFQVELLYRPAAMPLAGASVTEEFAREFGYLHLARLSGKFRKSLRNRVFSWLEAAEDAGLSELADLELEDLVKQRPMLIHRLMAEDTHLSAVIHPVFLPGNVLLRIATVRNTPDKIERVYTRFYQEIVTTV
jgi:hypothetical protein